ncbi:MAG: NUDIX domain-containing protein [Phycisphaerales bacterium]|nr:NUDIX domain-containing protein [Phycisphaerales bacterium]
MSYDLSEVPYRIAVLCYLKDASGRVLLLHRRKEPNAGLYSPIGGKLEVSTGEGPHACAIREIEEEAGIRLDAGDIRMFGIVSEASYERETHWLIFLFEVTRPIEHDEIEHMTFDEGVLEWVEPDDVESLNIPETDRQVMWPNVRKHHGGFFVAHIDCATEPFTWTLEQSIKAPVKA